MKLRTAPLISLALSALLYAPHEVAPAVDPNSTLDVKLPGSLLRMLRRYIVLKWLVVDRTLTVYLVNLTQAQH